MSPVTLLALDIGNTSLTIGLFREDELIGSWRATTRAGATPDEAAALVRDMLGLDAHRLDELTAVGIASVVPPLTERFVEFAQDRLGLEPMVVDAATLKGILPIEIDRPAEAGADRLCNALAAGIEVGGPAIVIDLGTSTNFDVIDARGAYLGGAIAPGLGVSLEALVGRASKLPRIALRRPEHAIGANTVAAMQSRRRARAHWPRVGPADGPARRADRTFPRRQPRHGDRHRWLHQRAVAGRRAGHRPRGAGPHPARHPLRVGAHPRRA